MVNPLLKLARQAKPKPTKEPEQDSLLKKAGRTALSGLAAVGNLLDIPGSMVRDTLSGNNPLDQLLSPLSSESRVTGRDLLRKAGLVGRKDTWANWGSGLATEIALDPLTYLTGGLTKAGSIGKTAGLGGDLAQIASKAAGKQVGRRVAEFTTSVGDAVGTSAAKQSALEVAAKAAGKRVAEIGSKPFRESLFGYKIPFTKIEGSIKLGQWEQSAAKYLDAVEDVVRYGKYSPVTHLAPLFSKALKGARGKLGQQTARAISEGEDEALRMARRRFAPHVEAFQKSGVLDEGKLIKGGMAAADARKVILGRSNRILEYLENVGDQALPPELEPLRSTLDELKKTPEDALEMLRREGLNPAELRDPLVKYFARQRQPVDVPTFGAAGEAQPYSTHGPYDIARADEYRDLVGGTAVLQRMSVDPKISGVAHQYVKGKLPKHVEDELVKYVEQTYPESLKAQPMSVAQGLKTAVRKMGGAGADITDTQGLDKMVSNLSASEAELLKDTDTRRLVRAIASQDPQRAKELIPLYKINPVEAGLDRLSHAARTAAVARGLRQLMVETADLVDNFATAKDAVPLLDVARQAGFTGDNAMELFAQELRKDERFAGLLEKRLGEGAQMPVTSTVLTPADVAGLDPKNAKQLLAQYGQPGALMQEAFRPQDYENVFRQIAVPREVADDISRVMKAFTAPEEVNVLIDAFDRITRLFKAGVTSIFPAFHVRNNLSAMVQNFLIGAGDPRHQGPLRYTQPILDMDKLLSGGVIEDAAGLPIMQQRGITDAAEATQELRRMMFEQGLTHPSQGYAADELAGNLAEQIPGLTPETLSVRRPVQSLQSIASEAIPRSVREANPLNISGVMATKDVVAPVKAGRHVAAFSESVHRGAGFIGLLRQGVDPTEAARRINLAQVDYKNLSQFERTVLRRVAPFYAFSKGALLNLAESLWQRPGGRTGQLIRGINSARDPDATMPDYVAETAAIPLGGQDGTKRFLTGFGLQLEDPLSFGGGGARGALLEAASRANPLVKAPLEWMTGQTFFQKGPEGGRPLGDLDPTVGRTLANITGRDKPVTFPGSRAAEFVLGNSPASRLLTTARQVSDRRKWNVGGLANLLTGVRVSDVSPAAQDAILREQVQRLLKAEGARPFVKVQVSKDELAQMPAEQQQRVRALQGVLAELANRAKARRKKK